MRLPPRLAAAGMLFLMWVAGRAGAQGNLSGYGLGYPEGQLSTAALATGGGIAEFDPLSPINPASLATVQAVTIHLQYDPEFRTVTVGNLSEHTTTQRFPVLEAAAPIGTHFVVGLSASSFMDRTWSTTTTSVIAVGDTLIPSNETFKSDGGITDVRLGGGWRVANWLRVGLGLHVFAGDDRITVARYFPDSNIVKTVPFTQFTDYAITGVAASAGVELQPTEWIGVAASYRVGGTLRNRLGDTLIAKGNVPPRAGGSIRLDPVPGLSIAARADWEGWSRLNGFGQSLQARDALELGGGLDVSGPRGSGGRPVEFRAGARVRNLPFLVNGIPVNETDVSAGLGIPVTGQRGTVDIAVQHANRTATAVGVGETAWTLSAGLTIRP
jgi:hypothetical protein